MNYIILLFYVSRGALIMLVWFLHQQMP